MAKYPTIFYVLCGTDGTKIESSFLLRTKGNRAVLCDKSGHENGWMTLAHCFLTKKAARDNWRWRASAESTEHVEAVRDAAKKLEAIADRLHARVRVRDHFNNL